MERVVCRGCVYKSYNKEKDWVDLWTSSVAQLENLNRLYKEFDKSLIEFEGIDPEIKKFRRKIKKHKTAINKAYENIGEFKI
jgi:hypothetical protein